MIITEVNPQVPIILPTLRASAQPISKTNEDLFNLTFKNFQNLQPLNANYSRNLELLATRKNCLYLSKEIDKNPNNSHLAIIIQNSKNPFLQDKLKLALSGNTAPINEEKASSLTFDTAYEDLLEDSTSKTINTITNSLGMTFTCIEGSKDMVQAKPADFALAVKDGKSEFHRTHPDEEYLFERLPKEVTTIIIPPEGK